VRAGSPSRLSRDGVVFCRKKRLTLEPAPGCILTTVNRAKAHLRSGEIANQTGVSADTIRHYERLGILPKAERTSSGYRMYLPDAVERVRLAQRALQLGFSLNQLAGIFRTRDAGGAPCQHVLDLAEEKLRTLEGQIRELRRTHDYMRQIVRDWRRKVKQTPSGSRAMLIHSLVDKPEARSTKNNLKWRSKS